MKLSIIKYQNSWRVLTLLFFMSLIGSIHAQPLDKNCAMVLMHGKWGNPRSMMFVGKRYEELCATKSIEMPWSQRRNYDQPYEVALNEIEKQVKEFRTEGYKKIFLVGHSFGANAGFAYAASIRDKVDGIVALAPGHSPSSMYLNGLSKQVDQSAELIKSGLKDEMISFVDMNQGVNRGVRMTAEIP